MEECNKRVEEAAEVAEATAVAAEGSVPPQPKQLPPLRLRVGR